MMQLVAEIGTEVYISMQSLPYKAGNIESMGRVKLPKHSYFDTGILGI